MAEIAEQELIVSHSLSTLLSVGNASIAVAYLLKGRRPPERRSESLTSLADVLEDNTDALATAGAIGPTADYDFLLAANAATHNGSVAVLSKQLRRASTLLRKVSEAADPKDLDRSELVELKSFLDSLEDELAAAAAQPTDIAPQ